MVVLMLTGHHGNESKNYHLGFIQTTAFAAVLEFGDTVCCAVLKVLIYEQRACILCPLAHKPFSLPACGYHKQIPEPVEQAPPWDDVLRAPALRQARC